MKAKVFIVQRDNDKYFKQKLPTWRNGFCEIERNVTLEKDPHDIYQDGEWGYITVYGRKIYVTRAGTDFVQRLYQRHPSCLERFLNIRPSLLAKDCRDPLPFYCAKKRIERHL